MKKFNMVTNQNALVKSCVVPVHAVYGTIKIPHTIVRPHTLIDNSDVRMHSLKWYEKKPVTLSIDYVLIGFKTVNGYHFPICKLCYDNKQDSYGHYIWSKPTILWGRKNSVLKKLGIQVSMLCKEHGIKPDTYAPDFNIITWGDIQKTAPRVKRNRPINDCRYYNPVPKNQDMQVCTLGLDNTFRSLLDRSK